MADTKLVIPGKDGQVCFQMRQTTGEIDDNHATLLGISFTAAIIADAHPAFVQSVIRQLKMYCFRETISNMNVQEAVDFFGDDD